MNKYLSQEDFHVLARRGDAAGAALQLPGPISRSADDGSRVVTFCFSDGSVGLATRLTRMVGNWRHSSKTPSAYGLTIAAHRQLAEYCVPTSPVIA
jgi:hypothetical protein